jgi:small subunit ribosomal protein S2
VTEANRLNIPVIAIADTNADPNSIQIVVPGNDDAIRSIKLFCSKIAEACIEGSRMGKARAVSDVVEQEAPETIRVHTGGDGPKVEIVSRRTQLPAPEAAATPEEGPLGAAPTQGE